MRFGWACLVRRIKNSKSAPLVPVGVRAREPAVHARMAVGYTRSDGTGEASCSVGRVFDAGQMGSSPRIQTVNHALFISTVVAYALSFSLYLFFLNTGKVLSGRLGTLLLATGLVTHYFVLLERSRGLHTVPYHDLYGSMSLFGWLLALTYLGLEFYHRQRSVGAFVLPFILVFFLAAHLAGAGSDRLPPTQAHDLVLAVHLTLSILGYAAFA